MREMAEYILPPGGSWVGPPVIFLKLTSNSNRLEMFDGRRRLAEIKKRGLKTRVPEIVVTSHLALVRALIHNGHAERAAEYALIKAPHLTSMSSKGLGTVLELSRERLKAYLLAVKAPSERHKLPRRAMGVVKRGRALYKKVVEGESLELRDLEHVLGPFLDE